MKKTTTIIITTLLACVAATSAVAQTMLPPYTPSIGGVVHGGQILSDIVAWGATAFGTVIAAVVTAGVYKFLQWMGIQVTDSQKTQLQAVVVNGLNAAASRAQTGLKSNTALDISVQSQVVNEAVRYAQDHAADTIKALGLDPESGQAVEAIRARIATAIVDPTAPTNPAITPAAVQPR